MDITALQGSWHQRWDYLVEPTLDIDLPRYWSKLARNSNSTSFDRVQGGCAAGMPRLCLWMMSLNIQWSILFGGNLPFQFFTHQWEEPHKLVFVLNSVAPWICLRENMRLGWVIGVHSLRVDIPSISISVGGGWRLALRSLHRSLRSWLRRNWSPFLFFWFK